VLRLGDKPADHRRRGKHAHIAQAGCYGEDLTGFESA
jgi:hypothetical protein